MIVVRHAFTLGLALAMLTPAVARAAQAPSPTQTGTQFYQAYRKALAKAQKIDELLPMMTASRKAEVEKTPADERTMMFEMIKGMAAEQGDIKVLKETATDTGAKLSVQTKDGSGVVTLIKEGGAWKVDEESWTSKM